LREHKSAVHIIAGIEEHKHIGAADQIIKGLRPLGRRSRESLGGAHIRKVAKIAGWFISFRKGCRFLQNAIFIYGEIFGLQARDVISFLVGHSDVELNHVDRDVNVGVALRFSLRPGGNQKGDANQNQQAKFANHDLTSYSAIPSAGGSLARSCFPNIQRITDVRR